MFTGIVTDVGEIVRFERHEGGARIAVSCAYDAATIDIGASIACAGVCLTAVEREAGGRGAMVTADVSAETLAVTTLGDLGEGARINLERPLKVGDELGGHIVQGHVDGVAIVIARNEDGDSVRFRFEAPAHLARFIASKGSVTLDGTSLTVNDVEACEFEVNIVPHTLNVTTWGERVVGDKVNLEIDVLARYVQRLAEAPELPR